MSLILCKKHGEVGLIPTVSAMLSRRIKQGTVKATDVGIVHLKIFDEREFLEEDIYFIHLKHDKLKNNYIIRNEKESEGFSDEIRDAFSGGGHCVYCFKEYMEQIRFDLNNLPAPSGLTI